MRVFLKTVKPFTRGMRITVGVWRWIEAAPCRRGEVGVEEFMVSAQSQYCILLVHFIANSNMNISSNGSESGHHLFNNKT